MPIGCSPHQRLRVDAILNRGSQYLSDHFQGELRFLGIRSSPSFVAAPGGNGCAERFIRTLKEQLLWVEPFETVQQLRLALLAFKDRSNQKWLVERHGHRTPAAVRSRRAPERLHDYRERSLQETRSGTRTTCPSPRPRTTFAGRTADTV